VQNSNFPIGDSPGPASGHNERPEAFVPGCFCFGTIRGEGLIFMTFFNGGEQDLHTPTANIQQPPDSAALTQRPRIGLSNNLEARGGFMPRRVEVKKGQRFQDGTGLTVRVGDIEGSNRVRFSVIEDGTVSASGEMSYSAFVNRFSRIQTVEDSCVRIKRLGYVAHGCVRIYGEEFELLSDPFPEHERVAICARAKSDSSVRVLRLPLTLVQSGRDHQEVKAA